MYGTMYGATKYGSLGRLSGSMPASVGYMALAGTAYPSVRKMQTVILLYGAALGSGGADGVYGGKTHRGLKRALDVIRVTLPATASSVEIDRIGPIAVRDVLYGPFFGALSPPEVAEIQAAWRTWKDAPPASHRDLADTPAAAEEPAAPPPPPPLDEGMGTGTWILLLLLGAAGAYGVYYLATR